MKKVDYSKHFLHCGPLNLRLGATATSSPPLDPALDATTTSVQYILRGYSNQIRSNVTVVHAPNVASLEKFYHAFWGAITLFLIRLIRKSQWTVLFWVVKHSFERSLLFKDLKYTLIVKNNLWHINENVLSKIGSTTSYTLTLLDVVSS